MKLSEYRGEEALDLLADLIEPAGEIFGDAEFVKLIQSDAPKTTIVKTLLKNHKRSVIEILAAIDGVPAEDYSCNVLTLPLKVLEVINDKDLISLFQSQGQKTGAMSFGSAMANTEEKEE